MNNRTLGSLLLVLTLSIVIGLVVYTNALTGELALEEQKRMEIWAEAQSKLMDESADLDFTLKILEQNTTIPVFIIDDTCHVIAARNIGTGEDSLRLMSERLDTTQWHGPIDLTLDEHTKQYIYYGDSSLLTRLHIIPYVQFGLIFLFFAISFVLLYISHRSQKNLLWAGLSKETAHQLGTPISSLNAWYTLMQERYPSDEMIPQMEGDLQRLSTVAERFSKIGSEPELRIEPLQPVIENAIRYLRTRVSNKVDIQVSLDELKDVEVEMSAQLIEWVIENLSKNAVDAMSGAGILRIGAKVDGSQVNILVEDTGKGIAAGDAKRIFEPGYTTKKRGWGLGLALSKRIIEQYHEGRLYLQSSRPGATIFCIQLKQSK